MIVLSPVPFPRNKAIDSLRKSKYTFHLCGSRFMGCPSEDSDWDFMTEGSTQMMDWLRSEGFTEAYANEVRTEAEIKAISDAEFYGDGFTEGVMELDVGGAKIQVQLCTDLRAKLYARNKIARNPSLKEKHEHMNNAERRELWHRLCAEAPPLDDFPF